MPDRDAVVGSVERAAESIAPVRPLPEFVATNPLAGFEDRPFPEAVAAGERLFGGRGYPGAAVFRDALSDGRIDGDVLAAVLDDHGVARDSSDLLDELAARDADRDERDTAGAAPDDATATVDRLCATWLAAFLDQGRAAWSMPNRERGFYTAWRAVAPHDRELPADVAAADIPETPLAAIERALRDEPLGRWEALFERHLAALPGWSGFVRWRAATDGPWQSAAPISLLEYLGVRLALVDLLDAPVDPAGPDRPAGSGSGPVTVTPAGADEAIPIAELFLTAWERSYCDGLLATVDDGADAASVGPDRQAAQLVHCIDTRSAVLRRHVEAVGPYETFGYAGFFGVPMRYHPNGAITDGDGEVAPPAPGAGSLPVDACPPGVEPECHVTEQVRPDREEDAATRRWWRRLTSAAKGHLASLKHDAGAAFAFVEGGGTAYGAAMATRTLLPSAVRTLAAAMDDLVPSRSTVAAPSLDRRPSAAPDGLPHGMTLAERVDVAAAAFETMGVDEFARLVVFVGHASTSANNPFDASLQCGACAGNPGGPSARVLAAICNDEAVRERLRERGIAVPEDTHFLAAEHDTTTDEVTLFDAAVPESHREDVVALRGDLSAARERAARDRLASLPGGDPDEGVAGVERRAVDWAEPRPEWGLAGNAGFVVGPRALTAGQDLDGRAFLHAYDWSSDPDGTALEAILTGPVAVAQAINSQYYFSTVDGAVYGSDSKVTQNPWGNAGVRQGNGGDLETGLPVQSVVAADGDLAHQPIRLSVVVHAPVERVTAVLGRCDEVATLLDNGWLSLSVLDPEREDGPFHYAGDLEWTPRVAPTLVH